MKQLGHQPYPFGPFGVIIIDCKEGVLVIDSEEFRAAFEEHKNAVYRFAWRITNSREAAEDITQEVFLSLLRRSDRFDAARGTLRPFLLAIARNLALKLLRHDKNRWINLDRDFVAQPVDIVGRETEEVVRAAVQFLPPLQREVVILAQYEGLSLEEIAQTVQADVGTVKSRLHRARENLRRLLAPLKERLLRASRL